MIKNFFVTAWRNIGKYKVFSAINFVGLTTGLGLSLLILSYVRHELSFDRFHDKADRLYRMTYTVPNGLMLAATPPPIAPLMKEHFPGVEEAARVYSRNVSIRPADRIREESYEETDVLFADSALTKMFTFSFVSGTPGRALREPFSLLITEEMAKKYFGEKDAVGQTLLLAGDHPFRVTGVVRNFPTNSHLRFHMLVPFENMFDLESDDAKSIMRKNLANNFVISHSFTYVLLRQGFTPEEVDNGMGTFLKKYAPVNRQIGQIFTLMPLTAIHMTSSLNLEPTPTNTMSTLYIFSGIGLLTLLIASINYINLATAQSFTRVKEIGIRKILGSAKSELITQFLAESFLFCVVSFLLSWLFFYLALPAFSTLTGTELSFVESSDGFLIACSAGLLIAVILLAGGYPAWFVAQFNSISALKAGPLKGAGGSKVLRRSLVVFQLMIACVLLSGSMMLVKQLNYLENRPLGFQKDHILTVPLFSQNLNAIFTRADSVFRFKIQTFRDRAERLSNVAGTTLSSASPGMGAIYRGAIPEGMTQSDNLFVADLGIDYDFVRSFGLAMRAGRPLSREFGTDEKEGFLVNETAVREFRWGTPEQALGKTIDREGKKGKVVGVVADFNMQSLTLPVGSLIMEISPDQWSAISVKIRNEDVRTTIENLRKEWSLIFPDKTFEWSFLDDQLQQQYSGFVVFGGIMQAFTAVAMCISCMGVYGLALFIVRRKVKEIGVRKVLGATLPGVLQLIAREFAWLILVGFALAIPISWYLISKWLENFQFHTSQDVLTYAASFAIVLIIVMVTISYHAFRAALANPVQSLRTE